MRVALRGVRNILVVIASGFLWAPYAHAATASDVSKIKHIIIIMQENRSFDHYFGTYPGADGIPMEGGKPKACLPAGRFSPMRSSLSQHARREWRRPAYRAGRAAGHQWRQDGRLLSALA